MRIICRQYVKPAAALIASLLLMTPVLAAPTELTLEDSIALTLANNQKLKIAENNKAEATWALKQAQALKGPTLNFSHTEIQTTMTPSWFKGLSPFPEYNYYRNQLNFGLPVYTGGKLEGVADQAKKGQAISELSLEATKQQLKLEATTGYFKVLQARNMLNIAQQTVDSMTSHLQEIQAKFDAGAVGLPDVLQTKVRLANAQNNLIKAQNAHELATYSLNNIMGLPLRGELALKNDFQYQPYTQSLDDCIAYAIENRPEINITQLNVTAKQDSVQIARSSRLPTVTVFGNHLWDDNSFPGDKYSKWTVGMNLDFNIFDSQRTTSQINQAKASVATAQNQAQKAAQDVSLEVSAAYLGMKEAEKRLDTSSVTVEQAETDLKLAKQRYNAGIGINLDVMDAELALNQARTNYVQALYDYNTSKSQLEKAMGIVVK